MALSSLTFLSNSAPSGGYYIAFNPPVPGRLTQGELENQLSFSLLGYTAQNQNVLVFAVTVAPNTYAAISLNGTNSAINVVDQDGSNSVGYTNYYSVDLGMNSVSGGSWELQLNATMKDKKTGTWVFVKSSGEPPHR